MLDTVEIAKKIKSCAKNKGIRLCDMLNDLELGVNAISQLSAGKEMSYVTFAKIADYLGVSVDYLLGKEQHTDDIKKRAADIKRRFMEETQEKEYFTAVPIDMTQKQSESNLHKLLDRMSDEDLKKVESFAAFLASEKEKEKPPVDPDIDIDFDFDFEDLG